MAKNEDRYVKLAEWAVSPNIATELDDDVLGELGRKVVLETQIDLKSRSEWEEIAKNALDMARQKRTDKNYPFEKASNVRYPLLATAALQFAARAYPSIVNGPDLVKAAVIGADPNGEKKRKGERFAAYQNYQINYRMTGWEEEFDVLLHQIPIVGCGFKKVFRDQVENRNASQMISALDLIVNQSTRSLDNVPRVTHRFPLYPQEVQERQIAGTFLDIDLPVKDADEDAPQEFYEQHRYVDLDGDDYREPYIVTVHKETEKVVRVVANYTTADLQVSDEGDLIRIKPHEYFVKYPFIRDPEGGFYDVGLGHMLSNISETIDTTVNQMLDAGHLQNAGGGFIGSGLSLKKSVLRAAPGVYHTVSAAGNDIRQAIVNHEHPGPAPVLFQLLGMMIDAGKDIASIQDIMTGDVGRSQPATTTLAQIEQGMKVYTAIYKRIHRALRKEFRLLAELTASYADQADYAAVLDDPAANISADYDLESYDIAPVADPRMATDMQKAAKTNVIMQLAVSPLGQRMNPDEIIRRVLADSGIENADTLLMPQQQGPNPMQELEMMDRQAGVAKTQAETEETAARARALNEEAEAKQRLREAEAFGQEFDGELASFMAEVA